MYSYTCTHARTHAHPLTHPPPPPTIYITLSVIAIFYIRCKYQLSK